MPDRVTEVQLRQIYGDTIAALYGYASRRCGGRRELAQDVTQEAWLRAVREWRRTGAPRNPLAWLTVVARNLILNHFRRREVIPIDSVSPAEVLAAVEENAVSESADIAALVARALERIPEAEARLVEAFHYDRYNVAQLATSYGVSERAIEGRLRRARARLRREIELTLQAEGGIA
jgi:RNA polymerase sigma-70 factor (ECF subfamily)